MYFTQRKMTIFHVYEYKKKIYIGSIFQTILWFSNKVRLYCLADWIYQGKQYLILSILSFIFIITLCQFYDFN